MTLPKNRVNISPVFKNFLEGVISLIYPSNCILCKNYIAPYGEDKVLCADCRESLEINKPPFCVRCSRPVGCHPNPVSLCPECLNHKHYFDSAWAATCYNLPMQKLIHMFKYQSKTSLRKIFATLMVSFIKKHYVDMSQFDYLIPVPLYKTRFRERGYNQAELLTERLAQEFNLPVSSKNLVRVRPTRNQALLGKKDRFTNIQGAFTIRNSGEFFNKSLLVVDDLLTTGITTSEAARTLKEAGAKKVSVLTLAIAN